MEKWKKIIFWLTICAFTFGFGFTFDLIWVLSLNDSKRGLEITKETNSLGSMKSDFKAFGECEKQLGRSLEQVGKFAELTGQCVQQRYTLITLIKQKLGVTQEEIDRVINKDAGL